MINQRVVFVAALLALSGAAGAATVDELKDAYARQDYKAVVAEADRRLISEGNLVTDEEAYALMVLKAEALLKQGFRSAAAQQFTAAARIAPGPAEIAWARASRLLLQYSGPATYIPKAGDDQTPIDIINTESRKKAFAALLRDTQANVERLQRDAMMATTLPELEDALVTVADAAFLEIAATGEAKRNGKLLGELTQHTQRLISNEMLRIGRQVAQLDRLAASYDEYSTAGRRGLSSRERDALYDILSYLDRVSDRVQTYRRAAERLNGDTATWDRIQSQMVGIQADAEGMLMTRY